MYRQFDPDFYGMEADSSLDIDDPWYGGDDGFIQTLNEIEHAADEITAYVRETLSDAHSSPAAPNSL